MNKRYDLIVLGAGIAGCESAWHAAENGAEVMLLDMSLDRLSLPAHMPAIFVRPGHMGKVSSALENTIFGRALKSSFLGCFKLPYSGEEIILFDRREHSLASKDALERKKGLDTRQALVKALDFEGKISMKSIFEEVFSADMAVIALGSYLKGRISTGKMVLKAGRYGDLSSEELEASLLESGVKLEKWVGYAPETLDIRAVDVENWQKAEELTSPFSRRSKPAEKEMGGSRVLWRKVNDNYELLISLGPRSTETVLLREDCAGENNGNTSRKVTVRAGFIQESLHLGDRGGIIPEELGFAGSFTGETGYLACIDQGRSCAAALLGKA